jgi:hypothetical protein
LRGISGAIRRGDLSAIQAWLPRHYTTAKGHYHSALANRRREESQWVGEDIGHALATTPNDKREIHLHNSVQLDGRVVGAQHHETHRWSRESSGVRWQNLATSR